MDKRHKDKLLVEKFIGVYCAKKHSGWHLQAKLAGADQPTLCPECAALKEYAFEKLDKCPFDPKPKCKDCRVHCYAEPWRSQMKEVMKFSGIYFVKRGRLDWLFKYLMR